MGKFTGEIVATVHGAGLGSAYFGNCEVCGQHASESFVQQKHRVFVRDDGLRYLGPMTGGTYGHRDCLNRKFGTAVDKAVLNRSGNLILAPALNAASTTSYPARA